MLKWLIHLLSAPPEPPWQYSHNGTVRTANGRTEQLVTTGWSEDWEVVDENEKGK